MLKIIVPGIELFDENTNEFIYLREQTLLLEHSLVSISKWESKWCKPFLNGSDKTPEEIIDYIRCMTVNEDVDYEVYDRLSERNFNDINRYIEAPMTATTFRNERSTGNREIITSELIYYWMVSFNIPFECQTWHLNRLLTLVRVCNVKNNPPKKMSRQEVMARNRELNNSRKNALNTHG